MRAFLHTFVCNTVQHLKGKIFRLLSLHFGQPVATSDSVSEKQICIERENISNQTPPHNLLVTKSGICVCLPVCVFLVSVCRCLFVCGANVCVFEIVCLVGFFFALLT